MTKDEYANAARELGRLAFEDGRPPVPAQDQAMMDLIAQNQDKPFGSAIAPLQQYHSGWIQANLAAPLPDDEDDLDDDEPCYGRTWRTCWRHPEYPRGECPTCDRDPGQEGG